MNIQKLLIQAMVFSIVISVGWVVLWTIVVPAIFGGRTWAGHESWIIPGLLGGMLGCLTGSAKGKR